MDDNTIQSRILLNNLVLQAEADKLSILPVVIDGIVHTYVVQVTLEVVVPFAYLFSHKQQEDIGKVLTELYADIKSTHFH